MRSEQLPYVYAYDCCLGRAAKMKDEKKNLSSTEARSSTAAQRSVASAAGSYATPKGAGFFALRKATATGKGQCLPAVGHGAATSVSRLNVTVATTNPTRAGGAGRFAESAASSPSVFPVRTATREAAVSATVKKCENFPPYGTSPVLHLGGLSTASSSSDTGSFSECKKTLHACSHADKQEALQRARSRLLWQGSSSPGSERSNIKGSDTKFSASGAAPSLRKGTSRIEKGVKGILKKSEGELRAAAKRERVTTVRGLSLQSRRKRRTNSSSRRVKKRKRKRRRKPLTAAQRAARRAVLLREVRVSPELLDVVLHTSAAAELLERPQEQENADCSNRTRTTEAVSSPPQQTQIDKSVKKLKSEMQRHCEDQQSEGETLTSVEPLLRQDATTTTDMPFRLSRPAVTRVIWQYVREHGLFVERDGCTVHADTRLQRLFGGRERVHLFKELQSLLVPHLLFYEKDDHQDAAGEYPTADANIDTTNAEHEDQENEDEDEEEDEEAEGSRDEEDSSSTGVTGGSEEDEQTFSDAQRIKSMCSSSSSSCDSVYGYAKQEPRPIAGGTRVADRFKCEASPADTKEESPPGGTVAGGADREASDAASGATLQKSDSQIRLVESLPPCDHAVVKTKQQRDDSSGITGRGWVQQERKPRRSALKRVLRPPRVSDRSSDSSSEYGNSSECDSSNNRSNDGTNTESSSSESGCERNADLPRRRTLIKRRLIKESPDSSGGERGRHVDTLRSKAKQQVMQEI